MARRSFERAAGIAARAAARVPFYAARLERAGIDPRSLGDPDVFRSLPPLTKEDVRAHLEELLADDADRSDLVRSGTGGSTGRPMPYYHDTDWWCRASAAAYHADTWSGWRMGERVASIWGTPLAESFYARTRRKTLERLRNFLFLPGFDLSPRVLDARLAALARFRPVLLTGYASLLLTAAERAIERGLRLPGLAAVISSAEPLGPEARAVVEHAFGVPVLDRYGCRELGIVAQEAGDGEGLYVLSDHVYVEIDVDGRPARPGEVGRLLITLLSNESFPLIRYEVGDLARAAEPTIDGALLPYPRLASIEGRLLDRITTESGGKLTGVFFPHLAKEHDWIEEFQVVQDELGDVCMRVVAERVPDAGRESLRRALVDALGQNVVVTIEQVEALERTPSGKVRVTQTRFRGRRAGSRQLR